ncbi:MAG: hypothetical protein GXP38_10610 [Chloroflexi bacterium]|nr:hypothetical protein [Chloroflexota bacterium]
MAIEFGLTEGPCNTQYAPLAAISALYQANHTLEPLKKVPILMKKRVFSPVGKVIQVFLSILAGCETLSEVNTRLKPEVHLATVWGWGRFADQSTLSRTLDALTLKQIDPLREATTAIWRTHSRIQSHDWRGYLWLDFDLSGLPCGPRAEASQKGYFSGKKTPLDANWHGSAAFVTEKQLGQTCSRGTDIPAIACSQPWKPLKML